MSSDPLARCFRRIRIGKLPLDVVTLEEALDEIGALVSAGNGGTVFTPNVDHIVMAERNARFREAYSASSLSLVDGMPVLWASHLLRTPLPAKVSGSDLILPLMRRAASAGQRVYLLGGDPGIAAKACEKLMRELPTLAVVGIDDRRIDVDRIDTSVLSRIRSAAPDLLLVALGAPKQELFAHEFRELLKPTVAIGVGAGLDFVAGVRERAPRWVSAMGLEWCYRLFQEPRRLAARYLLRDPEFCWIVARQLFGLERGTKARADEAERAIPM